MLSRISQFVAPVPDEGSARVEQTLERLETAQRPEDRAAALQTLQEFAKSVPKEIGTRGVQLVAQLLASTEDDVDVTRSAVEILVDLCSASGAGTGTSDTARANARILADDASHVAMLLNLLEETDFYVRYHTIQLLTRLLEHFGEKLCSTIANTEMGVLRLMDMLSDRREIIRNEILLLLVSLTKGDGGTSGLEVHKIVAFEGGFDRLLDIVVAESLVDGSIIVQDSLYVANNLLRENPSNQKFFVEMGCAERLASLLTLSTRQILRLNERSVIAVSLALETAQHVLSSELPAASAAFGKAAIITSLVSLASTTHSSTGVRARALQVLSMCMRGRTEVQAEVGMALVSAPWYPPQVAERITAATSGVSDRANTADTDANEGPALVRILCVALYSAEEAERRAAIECLRAFVVENDEGQLHLAALAVTPPPTETESALSFGRELLHALAPQRGAESASIRAMRWYACRALECIIADSSAAKEIALRGSVGDARLLAFTVDMASSASALLRVSFLRLLCTWLDECQVAAIALSRSPALLTVLADTAATTDSSTGSLGVHITGLAALSLGAALHSLNAGSEKAHEEQASALRELVQQTIGARQFLSALEALRDHEILTRARNDAAQGSNGSSSRGGGGGSSGRNVLVGDVDGIVLYDKAFAVIADRLIASAERHILGSYRGATDSAKPGETGAELQSPKSSPADDQSVPPTQFMGEANAVHGSTEDDGASSRTEQHASSERGEPSVDRRRADSADAAAAQLRERAEAAETDARQLRKRAEAAEAEMRQFRDRCEKAERESVSARSSAATAEQEAAQLRARLDDRISRVQELERDRSRLEDRVAALEKSSDSARAGESDARARASTAESELEQARRRIAALEADANAGAAARERAAALEAELAKAKDRITELQEENADLLVVLGEGDDDDEEDAGDE